ncbi:MAG TPA: pentapeptide repeat-containing protein [Alphaproteobacteria bacterium]|nr:pentapeptide repeat-containing protein [Alphaproteobacteria bacterium]
MTKEEVAQAIAEHGKWLQTKSSRTPMGHKAALSFADLHSFDLNKADLREADLHGANLMSAQLQGANLSLADLTCVSMVNAALTKYANLFMADLTNASLAGADLGQAKLGNAILSGASLNSANLAKADLARATMKGTSLVGTILKESDFSNVDLEGAIWQPVDVPTAGTLGRTKNLYSLELDAKEPDISGLVLLQKALQTLSGTRLTADWQQVRDVESAIDRHITRTHWRRFMESPGSAWLDGVTAAFRFALYSLTDDYKRSPWRGLLILIGTVLAGALLYGGVASRGSRSEPLLVRIKPAGRTEYHDWQWRTTTVAEVLPIHSMTGIGRWRTGLEFSFWNCLRLGTDSVNVGKAARNFLWSPDYLDPRGWVRFVAAVQSLYATYLIFRFIWAEFGVSYF